MILITGAGGKTGKAVTSALATRHATVRALVRSEASMAEMQKLVAHDILIGDMRDPADMELACTGVDTIYHICPNMQPDEVEIAQIALHAAQAQGVERFVYHSVLHPQTEEMPHHWHKLRVEEQLFKTKLDYTILQPAAYMQNVLAGWRSIIEQGIYQVPYAVTTQLGMVDLMDVAEAAAIVLTESGHSGATYELCGRENLNQNEVAQILCESLARPVYAESIAYDVWEENARTSGLGDYQVETLLRMFDYYEHYGFWGNSRVLDGILMRPSNTFADFVRRIVREK